MPIYTTKFPKQLPLSTILENVLTKRRWEKLISVLFFLSLNNELQSKWNFTLNYADKKYVFCGNFQNGSWSHTTWSASFNVRARARLIKNICAASYFSRSGRSRC
jgi:hypothetical protein